MARKTQANDALEVARMMNFNIHRRMITQYKAMETSAEFTAADKLAALVKMAPYFTGRAPALPPGAKTATLIWGDDE